MFSFYKLQTQKSPLQRFGLPARTNCGSASTSVRQPTGKRHAKRRSGGVKGLLVILSMGMIAVGVLELGRYLMAELRKVQQTIDARSNSDRVSSLTTSFMARTDAEATATNKIKALLNDQSPSGVTLEIDRAGPNSYSAQGTVTVGDSSGAQDTQDVLISLYQADPLDSKSIEVAMVILDNKPIYFNQLALEKVTQDVATLSASPPIEEAPVPHVSEPPEEQAVVSPPQPPKQLTAQVTNLHQKRAPLGGTNICFTLKNTSTVPISYIELEIKFTDYNGEVLAKDRVRSRMPVTVEPGESRECILRAGLRSSLSTIMPDTVKGSAIVLSAM